MYNKQNYRFYRKLKNLLPRPALIALHKTFVRPHLDYGDIVYDQVHNASFHQKLESLQCNDCLVITGAICGSSREKLCQKLGFESLQQRAGIENYVLSTKSSKTKACVIYSI